MPARADKPRSVRILTITGGPSMAAMIFKVPPHCRGNAGGVWDPLSPAHQQANDTNGFYLTTVPFLAPLGKPTLPTVST